MLGATPTETVVFFSEHFDLERGQDELDFVDIPVSTDVPLYVDPYAFKVGTDLWSIECNNLVVDFFQSVVDSIRAEDHGRARMLAEQPPRARHDPPRASPGADRGGGASAGSRRSTSTSA